MKNLDLEEYLTDDTDFDDLEDTMNEVEKVLRDEEQAAAEAPATNTPTTNDPSTNAPSTNAPSTNAPFNQMPAADEGYKPRPLYQSGLFWSIVAGMLVIVLIFVISNKVRDKKEAEAAATSTVAATISSTDITSAEVTGNASGDASAEATTAPAPLTMSQFNAIQTGQDYWTVKDIFGFDGNTTSMVEEDGVRVTHVNWTSGAQKIEVIFHDGLVYSKSEVGI